MKRCDHQWKTIRLYRYSRSKTHIIGYHDIRQCVKCAREESLANYRINWGTQAR